MISKDLFVVWGPDSSRSEESLERCCLHPRCATAPVLCPLCPGLGGWAHVPGVPRASDGAGLDHFKREP